ncbi:RagB/SusD family nutrient uptake outer membrane protein [Sphingobacterium sp. HMA12]|uniref:RagB/SusD family nutrient uptake outer membrane protein n=1 Tax=Sphingobacterium sp. HMA12 TaxID=2050894 RepID=UPI000CE9CBFC|nr:RagB/SusD family nutrient uptake outer membrane protein [Sphingobacterium sp. HMA12]
MITRYYFLLIIVFSITLLSACSTFLEDKPNQKMAVPSTLKDCDALLDDYFTMNNSYPVAGEVGADNYYLTTVSFEAISLNAERDMYLWRADADIPAENWTASYKVVFNANQVLDVLKKLDRSVDPINYDRIKGEALFFRAYAYMQLADVFTLPYSKSSSNTDLGIVLRETATVDEISRRVSLADTYQKIVDDLIESAKLLPMISNYKTRPTSVASYAALSRLGLVIGDYDLVIAAAEKVLEQKPVLIDYNTLNKNAARPFQRFNSETLFYAITLTSSCLDPYASFVDSSLYSMYSPADLRKSLYFQDTGAGVTFKAKYDGENNYTSFAGIVLDEVYLNLAEGYCERDNVGLAMKYLNQLMLTRFKTGEFIPSAATNKAEALAIILAERRKSLIMRNVRWMDLKRLNLKDSHAKTLVRKIGEKTYQLAPNDLRYAFLIPSGVIGMAPSINQNNR